MTNRPLLFVLDFLEYGGATRVVQDLSVNLKSDVYLLAGRSDDYSDTIATFKKVFTFPFSFQRYRLTTFFTILFKTAEAFHTSYKAIDSRKRKSLRIVLGLPFSALGVCLHPASWSLPKDYILHGAFDLEQRSLYSFAQHDWSIPKFKLTIATIIYYWIQRWVLHLCDRIIVFSDYSAALAVNHFKVDRHKIVKVSPQLKIPPSVRTKEKSKIFPLHFTPTFTILVPSRIEPRKGLLEFLHAVKELKKLTHRHFTVILTGEINNEHYTYTLFEFCKNNNLTEVYFIQSLTREKLFAAYKMADVICIPSIDLETLGLVTLESLSQGTPVVSFPTGATPELLSSIDSHLIAKAVSATALADVLKWFFTLSSNERKKLRQRSKKFFNIYQQKENNLVALYNA